MGSEGSSSLLYRLRDRLPIQTALVVSLQHVLAMFVGVISVPLLVAKELKLTPSDTAYLVSMGLFASGLGTFVQVCGLGWFGSRLLAVQGTSFAFLTPLIQAGREGGIALMVGMSMVCAPTELILAQFLVRLQRIFTPLVSGTVVLLIGLTLIPVGFHTMASGLGSSVPSWVSLAVSGLVLLLVLALNALNLPWSRVGAIPIALAIGYLVCLAIGAVPNQPQTASSWLQVPIPLAYGFAFRPEFLIAFILPYVITTLETVGDVTATSQLSDEPIAGPVYWQRIRGGVMGDSLNSLIAGFFNSFPSTTFAQNNGVIQLTGVATRQVGYWVAAALCLLGLIPEFGQWIALLPGPVLGAVTFLLFGFVATAGIRILQRVHLGHRELLIVAFSLGAGIGVQSVPELLNPLPEALRLVFASGITTGGIFAFLLNAILPGASPARVESSVDEQQPGPVVEP
jgi:xanthine permease XanP